ncbi:TenA family protein [Pseudoroseomonas globiformis]|uniref:TenA family protein n=1 Tax=Teichococcus globiformis TaxID=2307229 RepID=A0ABV7FZD7_9PROT
MITLPYGQPDGLFRRLRGAAKAEWSSFCWHPFVQELAEGTLPVAAFRRYLIQDWLFLIHFARAKALAAYKAESLEALRGKSQALTALLSEMNMHLSYCTSWGLQEADVLAETEAPETVAYTRWVLDRGMVGDILDLEVALAPCTVGYGEVALRIAAHPGLRLAGNPYQSWIDAYSSSEYQALAQGSADRIDRLGLTHGGEARFASLSATFSEAARLEAAFWQMGLDAAP